MEMDDIRDVRQILADALGSATGWDAESWEPGVDAQLQALAAGGFALVKLPEIVLDEDGEPTWPVDGPDRFARVELRPNGRGIGQVGVTNPIETPEQAATLAGALIAAVRYITIQTTGGHR